VYDEQGHLLGEYNSTGARIEETIWLNNAPAAVMTGTGTPTFYALSPDWQNTPHVIANSSGTFAWTWDRLDFGNNAPNQNPGGLGTFVYNPRFPGQLSDVESGLSNNIARDYNPVFGRYAQSDPIGLGGGVSTYGYVGGNPLTHTDAMGLDASCRWDLKGPSHCPAGTAKKPGSGTGDSEPNSNTFMPLSPFVSLNDPAYSPGDSSNASVNVPLTLCEGFTGVPCKGALYIPEPLVGYPVFGLCELGTSIACDAIYGTSGPPLPPPPPGFDFWRPWKYRVPAPTPPIKGP